jgi:hypothetical protein
MAQNNLTFDDNRDNHVKPIGTVVQCVAVGIDLTEEDYTDPYGFYIKVDGDEGDLTVIPVGQSTSVKTRFSNAGDGWNLLFCSKIVGDSGNTATEIFVGR